MDNKLNQLKIILNIVSEYFKIVDLFRKSEEVFGSQLVLHQKRKRMLKEKMYLLLNQQWVTFQLLMETRDVWTLNRTGTFWEKECNENGADYFKLHMRMSRDSFDKLCVLLKSLEKKDTNYRKAISLEKRIAIALYTLASCAEYRTIAAIFGVGTSTVGKILAEFCEEAWRVLRPLYMDYFPLDRNTILRSVNGFLQLEFPQCLGAIDGYHIEVHPKGEHATDYFNYKGWYSVVLFALVDANYNFMYINVGSPGRCNDSTIYENSTLKQHLQNTGLLKELGLPMGSVNVPIVVLADSAFRLSTSVMKPYPFRTDKTESQKQFHYALSKSRRVVENAFGHLKGRFRRIGKGVDNKIYNVNKIVKACCILHNFLITEKDEIDSSWLVDISPSITERRDGPFYSNNKEGEQIGNAFYLHLSPRDEVGLSADGVLGDIQYYLDLRRLDLRCFD